MDGWGIKIVSSFNNNNNNNNKYADLRQSGGMGSKDLLIYYIHDVMMTSELIKEG